MKRDAKLGLSLSIGLASVLTLANAMAQIQGGPAIRSNPATSRLAQSPKPTLLEPASGSKIQTRSNTTTPVLFRWSAPAGGPAPQRYRLCVAESGIPCGAQGAAVYELGAVTQYQAQVPPRLHNKQLSWSVAACGPGYGGGLALAGATNTDCTWSYVRALDARYEPQPPSLGTPGDGVRANTVSQRFTWTARQGQAVDGYRFCIADNVNLCRQTNLSPNQGAIVAVSAQRTFADIDVRALYRNYQRREMHWTVLSCAGGNCYMAANQPSRRFVIGGLPAPQLLNPTPGEVEPETGTTRTNAFVRDQDGWVANGVTFPADIDFAWSRVNGATGYKLCISLPGVACGTGSSLIVNGRPQGWESPTWASLAAFHGRAVNWTIASCDAIGCGPWAAPRPLTIKSLPGQVTLTAPADGSDLTSYPPNAPINFTWSTAPFAESYRIQLIDAESHARVLWASSNQCRPYRPWFPNVRGPATWKVQACNVVGCGPVSAARAITLYPPAAGYSASGRSTTSRPGSGGSRRSVAQFEQTTCP